MTKVEARQRLDSMGLPQAQVKAGHRTIGRATASEDIGIAATGAGDLLITRSRPGKTGHQVFEDTIKPGGSKQVVQKAYDADGNLIHHDPKGGTP
jgi:hypothetical protein